MSFRISLDHVVILANDLDAAGQAFADAGFHVTPKTLHSAAMGTANRCIMLDGSYIELMGIVTETEANATWRRLLSEGAGIRGFAIGSGDIEASASALSLAGMEIEPVRNFSRMTEAGELRFSVIRIAPSATPGLQCLACQHHTAGLVWLPETLVHTNGASRIVSISLPQAASLSALPRDESGNGVVVETGNSRLVLSGTEAKDFDLRAACGIELEIVAL